MKISYNWLQQFIPLPCNPEETGRMLTGCGLEIEQISNWQSIPGNLDHVVTGHILTCIKHPGADKLHITTVDTGENEPRQIVCGAPNVAAGQKVIVALPGAILTTISGTQIEIKKSKIRGEFSDGMICAEDEIGLSTSHAGIIILPDHIKPGIPAAEYLNIAKDTIFEIGLTPNRADAASHLGVARDLRALLRKEKQIQFNFPVIRFYKEPLKNIKVEINQPEGCIRYSGMFISGIKVQESPSWLINRLKSIGQRPVNNIVDITNYVMHHLGQPMHAFDADKIAGNKVIVDVLKQGTEFVTLDGEKRKLNGNELMICDGEKGMCIAGVFGGLDSGVTDTSTNIFLESACFNSVWVRKAARYHGLNTDSSFRFERGTDPEMTITALNFAAGLIEEIAGGKVDGVSDYYPEPVKWKEVEFSSGYLKDITGSELPADDINSILNALDIRVNESGAKYKVDIPPYRIDVKRPADVAEEILRIYGYNNTALPKAMKLSMPAGNSSGNDLIQTLNAWLVSNGFNEIFTNSLTSSKFIVSENADDNALVVPLLNPLSAELQYMRMYMYATGLESISYNINRKQKDLRLFETGKTYHKRNDVYEEQSNLVIYLTGNRSKPHWNEKQQPYDLFYLKSVVQSALEFAGVNGKELQFIQKDDSEYLENILNIRSSKKIIGRIGILSDSVTSGFDIKQVVLYAEVNLDILQQINQRKDSILPPPKFPEVKRDLSMMLDRAILYNDVEKTAFATLPGLLKEVNLFDVYEGDKIDQGKKSYALSFILRDDENTLQDKQIDTAMDKLMQQFEKKLGAVIRKQ